ncbi:hypothetical protein [Sphingomonas sp.]|jgi:hypothetical protein|uniref:LVIVD repeat-containing protein n=1 Tax=Sphingomonas sp. TaxID=28214 RepID=UPI002D800353|nr:hypothetical protein [Sphingomonas sp.]HEU0043120.1 hypothetical protein [Sphingomonas sp.]
MRRRTLIAAVAALAASAAQGQVAQPVETPPLPAGADVFALDLAQTRTQSAARNFEVVGHSYLKVPQRTAFAKAEARTGPELGSGTSSVAVFDGVAYVAGYSYPPTLFGVLMVDIRDPANMKPLGFVPCNAGTRCPYLRVDRRRKLLIYGNDPDRTNPAAAPGGKAQAGWAFVDVSNPRRPRRVGFVAVPDGATTHGMEIDGRYLYGCGGVRAGMEREAMQIIDYADPRRPREVATWHVPGMLAGETPGPLDRPGPDGKPQILQCHEIVYDHDRLYTAWRDAGVKIFDVKDRTRPRLIQTYDYVPPFAGGFLGATHTALPVITRPGTPPDLLVLVDEIFDCPSGFGRILDVSDMKNADVTAGRREASLQIVSTIRAPHVQDNYERKADKFACPRPISGPFGGRSSSIHLPLLDGRTSSLLYVTWYDEGLRAFDISNPFVPTEIGYYLSPPYTAPGGYEIAPGIKADERTGRQTREVAQDPDTGLIYVTDGNGGGLTVLRYTGSLPPPPIPAAR